MNVRRRKMIEQEEGKIIALIALLQVGLVIGGTAVVFAWSKLFGYREESPQFSEAVHLVRAYGLWMLLIPVLWVIAAIWSSGRIASKTLDSFVSDAGMLAVGAFLVFYVFVVVTGYHATLIQ